MNISQAAKGQIITRIEPRCYFNNNTGGSHIDDRYIGDKMTYHGIANGMIVLTKQDQDNNNVLITVPVHEWQDGWEYWIDPMTLVEGSMNIIKENLNTQLTKALTDENYDEAVRIRDEINKNKNMLGEGK